MKAGRPRSYRSALAEEICQRLADGETLRQICVEEHMPTRSTVFLWIQQDTEGFSDRYKSAREFHLESLSDDIVGLADVCREGTKTKTTKDGIETTTGDMVERARLQVDARKWLLSKLRPEKYGDKTAVDLRTPEGISVTIRNTIDPAPDKL